MDLSGHIMCRTDPNVSKPRLYIFLVLVLFQAIAERSEKLDLSNMETDSALCSPLRVKIRRLMNLDIALAMFVLGMDPWDTLLPAG